MFALQDSTSPSGWAPPQTLAEQALDAAPREAPAVGMQTGGELWVLFRTQADRLARFHQSPTGEGPLLPG
jgi:hypothetical protein